jgi:AAA+ ATPase superfamily predicted ATPase
MGSFVGRDLKFQDLKSWKGDPRLTAIYGRRRIGKTRLVQEASRGMRFLKFEGLEDQSSGKSRG